MSTKNYLKLKKKFISALCTKIRSKLPFFTTRYSIITFLFVKDQKVVYKPQKSNGAHFSPFNRLPIALVFIYRFQ